MRVVVLIMLIRLGKLTSARLDQNGSEVCSPWCRGGEEEKGIEVMVGRERDAVTNRGEWSGEGVRGGWVL